MFSTLQYFEIVEVTSYSICLSLSELSYSIFYLPCCCKCQHSILLMGQLLCMPFLQMVRPPHRRHRSPAKFPSLHSHRESPLPLLPGQVCLWSSVWNDFFPLLSGKLDLLVPSPTPQRPSPSLFTHLSLPSPLWPPLSENSETNIISHQVDFTLVINVCTCYHIQHLYCWPLLSSKTPEYFCVL